MVKDKFSRKGTVALRTLRRPTVGILQEVYTQKSTGGMFYWCTLLLSFTIYHCLRAITSPPCHNPQNPYPPCHLPVHNHSNPNHPLSHLFVVLLPCDITSLLIRVTTPLTATTPHPTQHHHLTISSNQSTFTLITTFIFLLSNVLSVSITPLIAHNH